MFAELTQCMCVLQISVVGEPVLNVNCGHIQAFDADLYRQLICYPQVRRTSLHCNNLLHSVETGILSGRCTVLIKDKLD